MTYTIVRDLLQNDYFGRRINPGGPEAVRTIEALAALVEESLYHLRLDEAAKAYHERALTALSNLREGQGCEQ